jgi:hypothetical protein
VDQVLPKVILGHDVVSTGPVGGVSAAGGICRLPNQKLIEPPSSTGNAFGPVEDSSNISAPPL